MSFPKDFLWGVATAAAQVEGGGGRGGRSPEHLGRLRETEGKDAACEIFPYGLQQLSYI